MHHPPHPPTRRAHWHVPALLSLWLVSAAPMLGLYLIAQRAVMEEIRQHARGVAAAAAARWEPELLDLLDTGPEPDREAYRRAQAQLERIRSVNPSVRYIYLMRRARRPLAPATAFEYLVDAPAVDFNRSGTIERDEESEAPGTPYDASALPAMVRGWTEPSADLALTPDPPYPDVLSGYAPIRDARGWTRALIGVDVAAQTVAMKLRAVRVTVVAAWFIMSLLLTLVAHFYLRQRAARGRLEALNRELLERNELLQAAGQLMAREAEQLARDRRLAQTFQSGYVRGPVKPVVRRIFDKPYLIALAHGPALAEVFDLDADHVGFFHVQELAPDRRSGLATHLLRTALFAWRDHGAAPTTRVRVNMTEPGGVMAWLNSLLLRELQSGEAVGLLYGVLNISTGSLRLSCAAHPLPLICPVAAGPLLRVAGGAAVALGQDSATTFPAVGHALRQGDRLLIIGGEGTDGPGAGGQLAGEEQLVQALAPHASEPPDLFAQSVAAALAAGRDAATHPGERSYVILHLR